jgi:hypothetical protein
VVSPVVSSLHLLILQIGPSDPIASVEDSGA